MIRVEMEKLTDRRRAILECIERWVNVYGYPPTVREIGQVVGLASSSSVQAQLIVLERLGYITSEVGKPRTLRVVNREPLL